MFYIIFYCDNKKYSISRIGWIIVSKIRSIKWKKVWIFYLVDKI